MVESLLFLVEQGEQGNSKLYQGQDHNAMDFIEKSIWNSIVNASGQYISHALNDEPVTCLKCSNVRSAMSNLMASSDQ